MRRIFFICLCLILLSSAVFYFFKGCLAAGQIKKEAPAASGSVAQENSNESALRDVLDSYKDFSEQLRATRKSAGTPLRPAPDFNLPDPNQKYYRLSDYKNKQPLILFFWTTWCPYCQKQMLALNDKFPALAKEGIAILAVNAGEPINTVKQFLKYYNPAYPVLLDEYAAVTGAYEVFGVPTYFLINKNGLIVFSGNDFPGDYQEIISR